MASATGGKDDWQSLLGVPNDPGDISLGSMMSDAVAPSASRAPAASSMPIDDSEPQIDQSYALATPRVQELGPRYEQGKATRKLSPLGQLFSLPTIGPQRLNQRLARRLTRTWELDDGYDSRVAQRRAAGSRRRQPRSL